MIERTGKGDGRGGRKVSGVCEFLQRQEPLIASR